MTARSNGFTLVEVAVVLAILGLLLAVAMPTILHARAAAQTKNCIENLWQIEQAKEEYVMDAHLRTGADVTVDDLVPAYLTSFPTCPADGTYWVNPVDTVPSCSFGGSHTLEESGGDSTSMTITDLGNTNHGDQNDHWYFGHSK